MKLFPDFHSSPFDYTYKWKMFSSHTTGGLGIGRVTKRRAVAVVASAITDLPTYPPTLRFQFCRLFKCNVQLL